MTAEPVLTTGVALDQLRTRSREFRCDGRILGEQHPELARRVGEYLDAKLGTAGGAGDPRSAKPMDCRLPRDREGPPAVSYGRPSLAPRPGPACSSRCMPWCCGTPQKKKGGGGGSPPDFGYPWIR
jgi:hypothetical protein